MTALRDAAQQALEALEFYKGCYGASPAEEATITALRVALAEPVQEPVAWMVYTLDGKSVCVTDNPADFTDEHKVLPLYTAQPQRKPLTEEEIWALYLPLDDFERSDRIDFARAIERAHGVGGDE